MSGLYSQTKEGERGHYIHADKIQQIQWMLYTSSRGSAQKYTVELAMRFSSRLVEHDLVLGRAWIQGFSEILRMLLGMSSPALMHTSGV
eukprot:1623780-Amphidinium_carterae.1